MVFYKLKTKRLLFISQFLTFRCLNGICAYLKGWFANGLVVIQNSKPLLRSIQQNFSVSLLENTTTRAKTNKIASIFISHLPINYELIRLVRRCDHITDTQSSFTVTILTHKEYAEHLVQRFEDLVPMKSRQDHHACN